MSTIRTLRSLAVLLALSFSASACKSPATRSGSATASSEDDFDPNQNAQDAVGDAEGSSGIEDVSASPPGQLDLLDFWTFRQDADGLTIEVPAGGFLAQIPAVSHFACIGKLTWEQVEKEAAKKRLGGILPVTRLVQIRPDFPASRPGSAESQESPESLEMEIQVDAADAPKENELLVVSLERQCGAHVAYSPASVDQAVALVKDLAADSPALPLTGESLQELLMLRGERDGTSHKVNGPEISETFDDIETLGGSWSTEGDVTIENGHLVLRGERPVAHLGTGIVDLRALVQFRLSDKETRLSLSLSEDPEGLFLEIDPAGRLTIRQALTELVSMTTKPLDVTKEHFVIFSHAGGRLSASLDGLSPLKGEASPRASTVLGLTMVPRPAENGSSTSGSVSIDEVHVWNLDR